MNPFAMPFPFMFPPAKPVPTTKSVAGFGRDYTPPKPVTLPKKAPKVVGFARSYA